MVATALLGFENNNELVKKLQNALFAYSQEQPTTLLYLHVDKNVYMPGETIWFKAYLPSSSHLQSDALFVRLVNAAKEIVLEKEFPVYDIRSNGDITLPDSLEQGTYQLYAYTDKMMNFDLHDAFSQQLNVVANTGTQLSLSAKVSDTASLQPQKTTQVLCTLTRNGRAVENAKGIYTISKEDGQTLSKGKLVTDVLGNAHITFVYPVVSQFESLNLSARFSNDNSVAEILLNLPPQQKQINIEAFAEGGSLVQGITGKLLIEAKDKQGQPLSVPVVLKKDGLSLAKITTNREGKATLSFLPNQIDGYSLVALQGATEATTPLPVSVLHIGWTLTMKNLDNKPTAVIHNQGMPDHSLLVLRSLQEIVWNREINVKSGDSLIVALPHTDTIKQVLSAALFSLNKELLAERLFLSHKQENFHVAFELSKKGYGQREKVKVNLKVTDAHGNPVMSNISVAAVCQKALNQKVYKTILNASYDILNKPNERYTSYNDQEKEFNDLLISKNWWHYSWTDILEYTPKGNIKILSNTAGVFGYVKPKKAGKPIKIQNLFLFTSTSPIVIPVQPDGKFSILPSDLLSPQNKSNYIFINDEFRDLYDIEIADYTGDADARITNSGLLSKPIEYLTATKPPSPPPFTGTRILKEVKITARTSDDSFTFHQFEKIDPKYCKDYVCQYNVLNCTAHPLSQTRPVLGEKYSYHGSGGYVYTHCIVSDPVPSNSFMIRAIAVAKDFPTLEYLNPPTGIPELLSTAYWNPNINTDKAGEASFEFYTSDLKGSFRIIVQGLEALSLRPLYGEMSFSVN
ncbi:MAG: hypothetical protein K0S09_1519 [Sphingobacteriaceae bacterium]|nr:hypothetical protein [Sphingobacteriaceae bacterium]